jgi:hypothetical protein
MLETFWEGAGTKVADRIIGVLLGPALVFWAGGALAYVLRVTWDVTKVQIAPAIDHEQLAFFIVIPTLVAVSSAIEQLLALPTLRLLEGYWPAWFPLRAALLEAASARVKRARFAWQALAEREPGTLSAAERAKYVELDLDLRRFPMSLADRMPTSLGNVLRAAERRPTEKYGLDAVICWPRLWLLLPGEVREEINEARSALDTGARIWMWGFLFLVWTLLTPWAVPVALLAMLAAWRWLVGAAEAYGDLLESAFDLFRPRLYESLRWPLPKDTDDEFAAGQMLTEYLFRGALPTTMRYEPSRTSAEGDSSS